MKLGGGIARSVKTDDSLATMVIYDKQDDLFKQQGGGGVQPSLQDRIYDVRGCSTAITTSYLPSIAEPRIIEAGRVKQGKHQQDFVQHEAGICRTICTGHHASTPHLLKTLITMDQNQETRYRIRKLTPRECFRLMGVDDADIDKIQASGISNSQQYKCAGNSIVVDTLYHLFRKMFCETENENTQPTLF